jgi:hypothetical protein
LVRIYIGGVTRARYSGWRRPRRRRGRCGEAPPSPGAPTGAHGLGSSGWWPAGHGSSPRCGGRDDGGVAPVVRTNNEEVWKHQEAHADPNTASIRPSLARGLMATCTGSGDHGHHGGHHGASVPAAAKTRKGERQVRRELEKVVPRSVLTKGEHSSGVASLRPASNGGGHGERASSSL